MTPELAFEYLIIGTLCLLGIGLLFILIKTIIGPRVTDRIVTINMTGTLVTSIIAILSVFLKQSYLSDVCIIYVLISFLSVVVLSNVFINRYIEEHKATNIIPTIEEDSKKEEKEDEK